MKKTNNSSQQAGAFDFKKNSWVIGTKRTSPSVAANLMIDKMISKELKEITSNFTDVSILLEKQKELSRKINRVRRKLKTKYNEYKFLQELVGIEINGDKLENALKLYFKKLGLERVEKVGKKYREEDIRLWLDKKLILFEVKGDNRPIIKDDKIFQILKHIPNKQKKYADKDVYGVFVCNHDNLKPFNERNSNPFDVRVQNLIVDSKLSVITTVELLKIFEKIEQGLMTKDNFISNLCKPGVYIIKNHSQSSNSISENL